MQTVGEILKNRRLEKNLTLNAVEKATKIREKFLVLIEDNRFDQFPSQTILKGFIKNYATFLGLNIFEVMAFYRRQSNEQHNPINENKIDVQSRFRITPRTFTYLSIASLLGIFFFFLIFQYTQFANAPYLSVDSPAENLVVKKDEIEVSGKTDPDAILTINDEVVEVARDGKFSVKVPLSLGLNTLNIKSSNKFQKSSLKIRHLRFEGN